MLKKRNIKQEFKVSLFPDLSDLTNFNQEYPFNSLNIQAAHLIGLKFNLYKCLSEENYLKKANNNISEQLFGPISNLVYFYRSIWYIKE